MVNKKTDQPQKRDQVRHFKTAHENVRIEKTN